MLAALPACLGAQWSRGVSPGPVLSPGTLPPLRPGPRAAGALLTLTALFLMVRGPRGLPAAAGVSGPRGGEAGRLATCGCPLVVTVRV